MKIKSGFVLRNIADQYMAVAVGTRARELHGMIAMNESAAFLWKLMESDRTKEDLVMALTEEYEITNEKAHETVERFIEKLIAEGVLEND